jgi:acetyl esterase/lipase
LAQSKVELTAAETLGEFRHETVDFMKTMRRSILSLCILVAHPVFAADLSDAELPPGEREVRRRFSAETVLCSTIRLWPDQAPDEPQPIGAESVGEGTRSSQIKNVTQPSVTVVRPKNATAATPGVFVCPRGGYGSLGVELGGVDVIRWLHELDITGAYLKYRVPKRHQGFSMHHQPLQDIQRAVSIIRSRAAELQIDPQRIGVIGFAAGGNLAAMLATHRAKEDWLYPPTDEADKTSCRPDFVMHFAPACHTQPIESSTLDPALKFDQVARNIAPPVFITSATTDKFSIGASHFALALRERHVSVEVHLDEKGGHAEGVSDRSDNQWPLMAEDWMRRKGSIHRTAPKP